MTLTYDQINDLDNSMVAAQQVNLGQIINYLSGSSTAVTGSFVPAAASTVTPVTGLSTIGFATVLLSGSVSSTHTYSTVSAGSAGNIIVKAWTINPLTGSFVAATTPFTKVVWTAYGS